MTFLFSIALAVFQQFELIGANYLNMEPQMENVAGKLFHSQPFSLAPLASRCTTCFLHLLRRQGFRPWGHSTPSSEKLVTFQPEDSTPCTVSTCAPSLCRPSCADTWVRDTVPQGTGDHTPWPTRESHYGGTAVSPKLRCHWVSTINLNWPFPDPVFQKALIYKTSH